MRGERFYAAFSTIEKAQAAAAAYNKKLGGVWGCSYDDKYCEIDYTVAVVTALTSQIEDWVLNEIDTFDTE